MKKNKKLIVLVMAVVAVALYFLVNNQLTSTIKTPLRDFAVEDTASINKIFLADKEGRTSLLVRGDDFKWSVNGKFPARPEAIAILLETIKTMEVRSPVGKNLYNHTMKLMSTMSVKVEIYQHDKLVKTYYVGHPTMDNLGTFMFLEGSSVPFIMHIPGFNGFLSTRFFAKPEDWRDRGLLRFDPRTIIAINIQQFNHPNKSFALNRNVDSTYSLSHTNPLVPIVGYDVLKLRKYLESFSKTFYERIDTYVSQNLADSLIKGKPFAILEVEDDRHYKKKLTCYRKPVTEGSHYEFDQTTGKRFPFDQDKFYVQINDDATWYVCQYIHFDKVLINPLNLLPGTQKIEDQNRF